MSVRNVNIFNPETGILAVMHEFLSSVDMLSDTVLFPVKLQDLDEPTISSDDQLKNILKQSAEKKEATDLFAIYMLLLKTRSELLDGNGNAGDPNGGETTLGKHLQSVAVTLKSMTKMAHLLRGQYETSLFKKPC